MNNGTVQPAPDIAYHTAASDDLLAVGRIYLRAFPGSLQDMRSPHLTPLAMADVLLAPRTVDPDCVIVAEAEGGKIVGYIVAPRDAGRIALAALRAGLPLRWLWRWITGRYHLSLMGVLRMSLDKIHTGSAWRIPGGDCPARIVSIAVDPDWQSRGIGRGLMEAALRRLHALGIPKVRLEVRPENAAAKHLYESMGFEAIGEFSDSRGPWLVMVANTAAPEARNA